MFFRDQTLRNKRQLFIVGLLVACQGGDDWASCEDTPCRQERLLDAWVADPQGLARAIGQLDPFEQTALVQHMADVWPNHVDPFCAELEASGAPQERCETLMARPHLKTRAQVPQAVPRTRSAPGPASDLLPLPATEAPWRSASAAAIESACDGSAEVCAEEARRAAARGETEAAGLACLAADAGRGDAYSDCVFKAAEAMAQARRGSALDDIFTLCNETGRFVVGCTHHAFAYALPDVTASDVPHDGGVDGALQGAREARAAAGEALADLHEGYFWSLWTHQAFALSQEVTGDLLDVLPEAAHPHVRFAAAMRLMQTREGSADLETLATELEAALARRGGRGREVLRRPNKGKLGSFWGNDQGEEEAIPATYCVGGRRPVSEDAAVDLQLALLEAGARLKEPPAAGFFHGALLDAEAPPEVRWTAARLGARLYPAMTRGLEVPDATGVMRGRLGQGHF